MGFGCPIEAGRQEWVERVHTRQLRLVDDGESNGAGPDELFTAGDCASEGRGDSEGSLEAYVRSLYPGSSCFCCGQELKMRGAHGGGHLLVCLSCGVEVERTDGE
jgi:hypothetical protein